MKRQNNFLKYYYFEPNYDSLFLKFECILENTK